jgi:hypothetical protein
MIETLIGLLFLFGIIFVALASPKRSDDDTNDTKEKKKDDKPGAGDP